MKTLRLGILATHPVQYYVPWYRALAARPELDLTVYYAHRQTAEGQAEAGFGVPFEWDVPLLDGYEHCFLENVAPAPSVLRFRGCDTPEITELLRNEPFDVFAVHGWRTLSDWQALIGCWRTSTPVMVRGDSQLATPRRWWKRAAKKMAYPRFIPRFNAYLVVGARARAYYTAYGADSKRMYFAPHFVDNDFFNAAAGKLRSRQPLLREEHGVHPDRTVFLFAGKFIPTKRPFDFIRAVAMARERSASVEGVMVGDGPLRMRMEAMIQRTNAPVRILGFLNQTEMPTAYAIADALVLPSDGHETWGLVVNEAMASGVVPIASDQVGCVPDLVQHGETGWVFPVGDSVHLTRRMVWVAEHRNQLAGMAAAAMDRVSRYSVTEAVAGTCRAVAACANRRDIEPEDLS